MYLVLLMLTAILLALNHKAMFFNLVLALGLSEVRSPSESALAVSSAKKLVKRDVYEVIYVANK